MNNSYTVIDKWNDVFAKFENEKIAIWGAGKTLDALMEMTVLKEKYIHVIIDKNRCGNYYYGYLLHSADMVDFDEIDVVLISSYNAQNQIEDELLKKYGYKNKIIKIYEKEEAAIFEQPSFFLYLQSEYKKRVEKLRKRDGKIRIGCLVSQNELWNMQSFYDAIIMKDKFDIEIISIPNYENVIDEHRKSNLENYYFFSQKGMKVVNGYDDVSNRLKDILEWNYDILFLDQPVTFTWIAKQFSEFKMLKQCLFCYVPYGFKVADGKKNHFDLFIHNAAWRIFAESDWHYEQFKNYGRVNAQNVVISGYPKLDQYLSDKKDYSYWKNGDSNKKRIIWAPHWSFCNPEWSYSTFDKNYRNFYEYAKENHEIDWIVKPHQRLYYWAVEKEIMSEEEVEEYFQLWNQLPNATVYKGGNYMDIFITSDALITDCGSFLAEYLPTKKPVLHLYNEKGRFNEVGQKIIDSYYRCINFEDVVRYIENVIIKENDYLSSKRLEIQKYVVPNPQGAGKAILEEFDKMFGR